MYKKNNYFNLNLFIRKNKNKPLIQNINNRTITYSQFYKRSLELYNFFDGIGLKKEDKIIIKLDNCIEYLHIYLSCLIGGFVASPIDPKIKDERYSEIKKILNPQLIIEKKEQIKFLKSKKKINEKVNTNNEFLIIQTSGTTGDSKGILFDLKAIINSSINFAKISNLDANSIVYHHLPMYYMPGVLNTFFSPLISGSKIVLGSMTSSKEILNFWKMPIKYKVNNLNLTPSMCFSLCSIFRGNIKEKKEIKKIKNIIAFGSPLYSSIKKKFKSIFDINLRHCYGITECGGPLTVQSLKKSQQMDDCGIFGAKTIFEIRNKINGRGKIFVKNNFLMKGYATLKGLVVSKDKRNFFETGDVGYLKNNQLYITGREKEIIKKGGELISLGLIESKVMENDQILEAASITIKDELMSEKIILFVSLIQPKIANKANIIESLYHYLSLKLKKIEIPDKIKIISEIPKNRNGKTNKIYLNNLCKKKLDEKN